MNERIRELMAQAGTDTSGKWMGVEHAERFAELIVEECIFAIDEQCSNSDAEGTIEAITILQKHFRS